MTLQLRCQKCNFIDIVKYENGKEWECPNCEFNQPERSKREDCNCPNRYLLNGTYMGKYCRCGALNSMET